MKDVMRGGIRWHTKSVSRAADAGDDLEGFADALVGELGHGAHMLDFRWQAVEVDEHLITNVVLDETMTSVVVARLTELSKLLGVAGDL